LNKPTPSFVRPFLYAYNRIQANESLRPIQYEDRAKALLVERLGREGSLPVAAFSHGAVGIVADHTHYVEGFALMLHMRQGTAIALRPNTLGRTRIAYEAAPDIIDLSNEEDRRRAPILAALLDRIIQREGGPSGLDVALVTALPAGLGISYFASLTVALLSCCDTLLQSDGGDVAIRAHRLLQEALGVTISRVFTSVAVLRGEAPFILVDARNGDHIDVAFADTTRPGFALFDASPRSMVDVKAMRTRSELAISATQELAEKGFKGLTSLRNLEHRDLERALELASRKYRPTIRHLVSSSRNVQKLVTAIRKADWQLFGAVLKISQASSTNDWTTGKDVSDKALETAERMSIEGIYGMVQTGECGMLLVAGRPYSLPAYLDTVRSGHDEDDIHALII